MWGGGGKEEGKKEGGGGAEAKRGERGGKREGKYMKAGTWKRCDVSIALQEFHAS